MVDLSIIIVNWNTKDLIHNCLVSIVQETTGIHFEIVVVDNGSQDGSVEMLKEHFPKIILIENEENVGYSKANNQGISHSTGRYVCLLNSDTVILENALSKMVHFLDENPSTGATTCLLINPDGSDQFGSALGETNLVYMLSVETGLYRKYPRSRIWGKPFLSYLDHRKSHELEVCPSAVIVIRKEVFKTVGGLDEKIFFGVIDWDFSYRIRKAGWKLYFFSDSRVIHYGGKSKSPIRQELLMKDYRSQYYYFSKHYGIFQTNLFRALIIISCTIKLALNLSLLFTKSDKATRMKTKARINNHWTRLKVSLSSLSFKSEERIE
jgi:GT2 family glycosyltransferase